MSKSVVVTIPGPNGTTFEKTFANAEDYRVEDGELAILDLAEDDVATFARGCWCSVEIKG